MVVIIFMIALIIGSFLNVVIYRLPLGESILFPSSYCPKCNIKLKWYELIPVIGYFLNGVSADIAKRRLAFSTLWLKYLMAFFGCFCT